MTSTPSAQALAYTIDELGLTGSDAIAGLPAAQRHQSPP